MQKTEWNQPINLLKDEFKRITGFELIDDISNNVGKPVCFLYMQNQTRGILRGNIELVNEDINLTSSDSLKFLFPIQYSSNYQNQIRIIKFTFYFIEDKVEYDPLTTITTNEVNIHGN
jgi:hypothetical protein